MSLRLIAVSFDSGDPGATGAFWAGILGRALVDEPRGVLLPGDATQVGLRYVESTTTKAGRNRLHLHVTSESPDDQRRIMGEVLRLGGRRRGSGPLPYGRDIYLSDPNDDEFCLIEPGNSYLAGCGPLGEVTCDGSRTVGLFWRDALGWPTVWDREEQIVIQSPHGGTKIAWDAWPEKAEGWNRQRFHLESTELGADVERLVELGANRIGEEPDAVRLTDPDGSEFSVTRR